MKRIVAGQFLATALISVLPFCLRASGKKEYKAKDGTRVAIVPLGKLSSHDDAESRIEFYSPQNQMLCALDYSSQDGEHGFGVTKAAWTPDEKYFVFSLASSGGHQPWHTPKSVYSVGTRQIRSLDRLTKAAQFAYGDFGLEAPNTVVLTGIALDEQSKPVKLALDKLLDKHRSQPALRCSDGQTFGADAVMRGTK